MMLYVEDLKGNRDQYRINEIEDLSPLISRYPRIKDFLAASVDLDEAVNMTARYISSGYLNAWVENDHLEKGFKEKAAALGISLATSLAPVQSALTSKYHTPEFTPSAPIAEPQQPGELETDFGSHPRDRFLWNIAQIESSGGKNTNHQPVKAGRFKGERAVGKWGLLKPTVNEIVNRMKLKGSLSPEYAQLIDMDRDALDAHLKKNPQQELDLARFLADHVITRHKGDKNRAAYSWLYGHNLFPSAISDDMLANEDYVNKYKRYDKKNPYKPNRALTMVKSEEPIGVTFDSKFKEWYAIRQDQKLEPQFYDKRRQDKGPTDPTDHPEKHDGDKTSLERMKDNIKIANGKK